VYDTQYFFSRFDFARTMSISALVRVSGGFLPILGAASDVLDLAVQCNLVQA
jgi:hypothetical protein